MKVALLQMTGGDHNLEKGLAFCRQARSCGADLALFPEMWNCGYDLSGSLSDIRARAVPADGPFVTAHRELAEELGMAVAVTFLEADGPALKNSVILFDRRGREVLHYAKVHTCDFGEERVLTRGEGFFTADLDTAEGPVADFPLGQMRAYRSAEVHGNAYRRPDLYGGLTEEGVLPPFVRPDRR